MAQDRGSGMMITRNESGGIHSTGEESRRAPRAGAELRAARERLGWALPDVVAHVRIRQPYLEALERGELHVLPGQAYTLGFLRTYASALGLQPDEVVRRFRTEAAAIDSKPALAFLAPAPETGIPPAASALFGLVMLVAVYAAWHYYSGLGQLPAETARPIPQHLASLVEQALPPRVSASLSAIPPQSYAEVAARTTDAGHAAEPPAPAPVASPGSAIAAPSQAGPPPAPGLAADQPRIVLRASADAWIQVRERPGPVLLARTMKAGETWPVPVRPNLVLTTGNAGGTELIVDGVLAVGLGGPGMVRRDLPLDLEMIRDGKLALSPAAATTTRPGL